MIVATAMEIHEIREKVKAAKVLWGDGGFSITATGEFKDIDGEYIFLKRPVPVLEIRYKWALLDLGVEGQHLAKPIVGYPHGRFTIRRL